MKSCLFLGLLTVTLAAFAQPRLLLNRLPYVPEADATPSPPLLNPQSALQILEPLPDFSIPSNLPPELIADEAARKVRKEVRRAEELLSEGELDRAVEILRDAVARNPELWNLRVFLADSLYAAEAYSEAIVEFEEVLKHQPLNFQALNNLGWLLATVEDPDLRDPARALELASQARIVLPNSHHMWSTLSQALYQLGDYRRAEAAAGRALNLARSNRVPVRVVAGYVIHRDRCLNAREATSILE